MVSRDVDFEPILMSILTIRGMTRFAAARKLDAFALFRQIERVLYGRFAEGSDAGAALTRGARIFLIGYTWRTSIRIIHVHIAGTKSITNRHFAPARGRLRENRC